MPFKSKKCISDPKAIADYDHRNKNIREKEHLKSKITRDVDMQLGKAETNKGKWIEGSRIKSILIGTFFDKLNQRQDKFYEDLVNAHPETNLKK